MATYNEAGAVEAVIFNGIMRVPDRLTEFFDWLDLGFLEREVTPGPAMELGIHRHVPELSLEDTV